MGNLYQADQPYSASYITVPIGVPSVSAGTPVNTTTPTAWLDINVGGVAYFLPLYQ